MPDLLFEIGTEELPSWYQPQALLSLETMLHSSLLSAGVAHGEVRAFATPRRLALLVSDLAELSERRSEERRGPPVAAAFDAEGKPTRAATGFAAKNGADPAQLVTRDGYVYATVASGGEPVAELLPGILARLVTDLPAPRKMRWGDVEAAFVRPVAWLLARLDGQVIPVSVAGRHSVGQTQGHRFMARGPVSLSAPEDYERALADALVLADPAVRREATRQAVATEAGRLGLSAVEDAELLDEVSGLVEYPFAVTGNFSEEYLVLPDEVLTTVLIRHQRFFPLLDEDGSVASTFVAVSNNRPQDWSLVRHGYEKVLDGRLYDARFFWDEDRSRTLAEHAGSLAGVGYQKELGSMEDKVARVGAVANALLPFAGLNEEQVAALQAALPLFRADLVTGMVYEFPELEGVMNRAYALAEGLGVDVAQVLADGVEPKGPDSALPASDAGAVLAIADRLEKLLGFMAIGRRPTGSADPFALRRDGIGLARLLSHQGIGASPLELVTAAAAAFDGDVVPDEGVIAQTADFIGERVASLLSEEGLGVHVVRAAGSDRPSVLTLGRRAHLLDALLATEEFEGLASLYKRVANIAARATGASVRPELFEAEAEHQLHRALPTAVSGSAELLELAERHLAPWDLGRGPGGGLAGAADEVAAALHGLLAVKAPLDGFLDTVHVMVDDAEVRDNRLALLAAVHAALRPLGDLGELEGRQA